MEVIVESSVPDSSSVVVDDNEALIENVESRKVMQYLAAITATIGGFSLGTSLAWTSPAFDGSSNFPFAMTPEAESWVGGLVTIGALLIAFPAGNLMSVYGRKFALMLTLAPFALGWPLIIAAHNESMLMLGRFLVGIGGGAFAVIAPTYTSEIAEKSIRGTLGSYFQMMVTLGVLAVYVLGGLNFSIFAISCACGVVPLIFGIAMTPLPDTPAWYKSKNMDDDARRSLAFFRGESYPHLDRELSELPSTDIISPSIISIMDFMQPPSRKALIISLTLMVIQQLSGVNAIIFYGHSIFKSAGCDPNLSVILLGAVQFVATFISTLIVDKAGRRPLLFLSSSVMGLCTLVLGIYFVLSDAQRNVSQLTWLPVVSLCVFIAAFSLGFGPIPWMMVAELFPPEKKALASPLASCFNWGLAFFITKFFSSVVAGIGAGPTFFIFSTFLFLGSLFVVYVVVETKGKTLEEILIDLEN